jgi:hypothetical protein
MFLGGNCTYRPFGSVILDGVDLDLEATVSQYYGDFVIALRGLMNNGTKPTNGRYWITGSPQCPFKDQYWISIEDNIQASREIDLFSIQFYPTQGGCQITASGFQDSFATWANWTIYYGNTNAKVYVGVPAAQSAAGAGYLPSANLTAQLKPLFSNPRFGGVMLWNVEYAYSNPDENYGQNVFDLLSTASGSTTGLNNAATGTTGTTRTIGSTGVHTTGTIGSTEAVSNFTRNSQDNIVSNNESSLQFATPAIVGVSIGGVVFIAVVVTVMLLLLRRKRSGCTTCYIYF